VVKGISRLQSEKKPGAMFNPNYIDPRKIKVPDQAPAGVNTNYGIGGGPATYLAQGANASRGFNSPRLKSKSYIIRGMKQQVQGGPQDY
jgi:hypothetical protein